MKWFAKGTEFLAWLVSSFLFAVYTGCFDDANPSSMQGSCHIWTPHTLRLPTSYLQPSGRASEREIRRCGARLFQFVSGSFQNENKILYFLLIFFLFFIFYSLHIPTAQLSAWWRIKWCWSIGERLKQEQAQWRILLYQLIGRNSVLDT